MDEDGRDAKGYAQDDLFGFPFHEYAGLPGPGAEQQPALSAPGALDQREAAAYTPDKQKSRHKEGLEDLTRRVITVLQLNGKLYFEEIAEKAGVEPRRLYDILNVLTATPLVSKDGARRDHSPFVWGDGVPLPEPVPLDHLLLNIEIEQAKCSRLLSELQKYLGPP